jgi:hypothetical protein
MEPGVGRLVVGGQGGRADAAAQQRRKQQTPGSIRKIFSRHGKYLSSG